MIIECINCNKKFKVNDELIPETGRQIICGSCNHSWHFKLEKSLKTTLVLDSKNITQQKLSEKNKEEILENIPKIKKDKIEDSNDYEENSVIKNRNKSTKKNNFFSYLLVLIISFVALIIVIDTLKSPLINIFPGLEIILFNLFETLKDIELFIIDLI
tara:strand:+ start:55 stop:528 length:474 start_codon:yes stop_codon:yes gene_type:complete